MSSDGERIIRDLIRGDFRLTEHAEDRMAERRVSFEDIRHCGETAMKPQDQGNGKYLIEGEDLDGDVLKVVAAWDGETVIVTVIGD